MATEAQRLIGISLTKIAQSRAHRGGVSLHKNLLVATVLQKARYIFMEEAYHMVHAGSYCPPPSVHVPQTPVQQPQQQSSIIHHHHQQQQHHQQHTTTIVSAHQQDYDQQNYDDDDDGLVALTPEEAGITSDPLGTLHHHEENSSETVLQDFLQPTCVRCTEDQQQQSSKDKENLPPPSYQSNHHQTSTTELTYLDLDKSSNVLRERSSATGSGQTTETGTTTCLKRRRAVTEWETEEAVLSILPKRSKQSSSTAASEGDVTETEDDGDDSVFLDEAALFSDCVAREAAAAEHEHDESNTGNGSSAMEIDRITSLVSIFSFGNLAVSSSNGSDSLGKLSRSVSTPDLCSAQAKESAVDALQQRQFLAMTV